MRTKRIVQERLIVLRVRDVLALECMAATRPIAPGGLGREVRWVHIWPEVLPWPHGGELLLTTAYSWPSQAREQRRILKDLDRTGVAAILFQAGGRFFPKVPAAITDEARALDLCVLEAAKELSFADLMEHVNRAIIRSQYETLERSEHIHRTLTEAALDARDVGDIAGRFAQLIGRRVTIVDRHLRPLTPQAEEWAAVCAELAADPREDAPASLRSTRRFTTRSHGPGVVFPVRAGVDLVGYLIMVGGPGEITELDERASEHAAVVIGLHLLRQQAVAEAEARIRHTFVEALLDGKLAGEPGLRERAQLLGFNPAGTHAVLIAMHVDPDGAARPRALASAEEFQMRGRLGHALQGALQSAGLPVFLAYSLNQILCIVPAERPADELRRLVWTVWHGACETEPGARLAVTVGRSGTGDADVPRSRREAEAALAAVRGPGVFWYTDMLVLRILSSAADAEALAGLHDTTLGMLERHGISLCETARALVASGFRQREAARALGIHWNTLRYRVARIEELLGGRLDDPEVRLRLHLALKVERAARRDRHA